MTQVLPTIIVSDDLFDRSAIVRVVDADLPHMRAWAHGRWGNDLLALPRFTDYRPREAIAAQRAHEHAQVWASWSTGTPGSYASDMSSGLWILRLTID